VERGSRQHQWTMGRGGPLLACVLLVVAVASPAVTRSGPAAAASVLPVTAIHLEGEADHWVLNGRTIDASGPQVSVRNSSRYEVQFGVDVGDSSHVVRFQAADATGLRIGSFAAGGPAQPEVMVWGDGGGCSYGGGSRLDILEANFDPAGTVQQFAARFEFHCDGNAPALFGTVTYRSRVDHRVHRIDPAALEFPDQPQGASSVPKTVSVANEGDVALTVSRVALTGDHPNDFLVVDDGCTGRTLQPAAACAVGVSFRPTVIDTARARLTIFDDTQPLLTSGRDVLLSGTAVGPPGSIDAFWFTGEPDANHLFGRTWAYSRPPHDLRFNSSSSHAYVFGESFSVTIEDLYDDNLQPGVYEGDRLGYSSEPGRVGLRFGLLGTACGPGSDGVLVIDELQRMRSGAISAISARFAARCGEASPRFFGAVSWRAKAPYRTRLVDPLGHDFGSVAVGHASAPRTFTVRNDGPSSLRIERLDLEGSDAAHFTLDGTTCPGATLAAGQACSAIVSFRPGASGVRQAELRLVDDVAMPLSGGQRLPLTGNGTTPPPPPPSDPPPSGTPPPASPASPPPTARSGYWMLGEDGRVYAFGDARDHGHAPVGPFPAVDLEPTPSGNGYWVVDAAGNVFAHGDAPYAGSVGPLQAGERVTSISGTPSGAGYWIFTTAGRVVAFGDAGHYGDMSSVRLNGPVLDSIPTPSGRGYYLVASDGGIFTFGDAVFRGSMGDQRLNAPVQSLVPDRTGGGYWLVASDGGIFAFDVPFHGSMGDRPLNRPVTGMVAFGGDGYLMVAEDGGIFTFGSAQFHGSLGDRPPARPIVAAAVLDH
jgi:hypothetical protein